MTQEALVVIMNGCDIYLKIIIRNLQQRLEFINIYTILNKVNMSKLDAFEMMGGRKSLILINKIFYDKVYKTRG